MGVVMTTIVYWVLVALGCIAAVGTLIFCVVLVTKSLTIRKLANTPDAHLPEEEKDHIGIGSC
jgi:hypothetical protein